MGDLPPLPPYMYGREVEKNERVWSEQCMRAYAQEAVKQEREACAAVCESTYPELRDGELVQLPCFDDPADCAAAIRARSEQ